MKADGNTTLPEWNVPALEPEAKLARPQTDGAGLVEAVVGDILPE